MDRKTNREPEYPMNTLTKLIGWLAVALFVYGFWYGAVQVCFYIFK